MLQNAPCPDNWAFDWVILVKREGQGKRKRKAFI